MTFEPMISVKSITLPKWNKNLLLLLFFLHLIPGVKGFSQVSDTIKKVRNFSASATLTNNGISLIPTFSLGKPAAIFDLSMGKRLSFDPQFKFALEGKPWSFVFWGRYKLINKGRFRLNIGGHPALTFKTVVVNDNGSSKSLLVSQRYLAGEIVPIYYIANNISIGLYYLYSHGLEQDATRNMHFITINSNFSNIKLSTLMIMKFMPQLYYLKMDNDDGAYFTSSISLIKKNFPIYISSIINKVIRTHIHGSKDFVWNVSLIYTFNNQYKQL